MNSYATAAVDSKDGATCLQSYHRGGFLDYQPPQSYAAVYLDQYRLQQSAYPATVGDHAASGPYSMSVGGGGGKTTSGAGYDQAAVGYGFLDLQETFRRDQWSLLGSAIQDGAKRLDSSGDKTAVSRACGRTVGDVERSAAVVHGSGGGMSALADSIQIKCEDGGRPARHHHSQQQQHPSLRPVSSGCSPTKHHHSKHTADSIKSTKGINIPTL